MRTFLISFVLATLLFFLIGPATQSGLAATILVPDDWATIQLAINNATDGDTVKVRSGTYGSINFYGKKITVEPLTATLPPPQCIIDGGQAGPAVTFEYSETSDSVLRGFLIRNGTGAYLNSYYRGGGILCNGASPIIEDNWIENNQADFGAGIACYNGADPTIDENVIIDNAAVYGGGGISVEGSSDPTITNNKIGTDDNNGNSAANGGGIYCDGETSNIHPLIGTTDNGNRISYNTATSCGGGIYTNLCVDYGTYSAVTSNAIHNNSAVDGGGVYCMQSGITIEWNVIEENTADTGGGIHLSDCHPIDVIKNRVKNNTATSDYGGGIYCAATDAVINTNRILQNWALDAGGGIAYINEMYGDSKIVNNQVAMNTVGAYGVGSTKGGAGIYIDRDEPVLVNNTVTLNEVIYAGDAGGVYIDSASSKVRNMIIWGNTSPSNNDYYDRVGNAELKYSDVGGHASPPNYVIDQDPLFVTNDAYLHITYSSPCKDSANLLLAPAIDFEGDSRPPLYDMGWDEYTP